MKAILAILLIAAAHAHALTAEEIRKIVEKPHSRENLVEALKIYPEARSYKITLKSGPSANAMKELPEATASEKTVEGKYIVSEPDMPDDMKFIMVVCYDQEADIFRKWILMPDGAVGSCTGIADFEKRTITWTTDAPEAAGGAVKMLTLESHSDDRSSWKETMLQDGKVVMINHGLAIKVR